MLGTIVNALAIILGGSLGTLLRKGIKDKYKKSIQDSIALPLVIIGIMSAIKSENIILIIISLVLGNLIGEFLSIEDNLYKFGQKIQDRLGKKDSNFSRAFIYSSLFFNIGAMGIIGALESGLNNNHQTLYAKSVLDAIFSTIFASSQGIGVAFSAIPVLIYQGGISLLAASLNAILTGPMINEISALGGIIILAIGVNQLGIKEIKIGNMLPAILIPVIYYLFIDALVILR